MKYNILIKYINSFPSAKDGEGISPDRLSLICNLLGRVNIGEGYIHISGGSYAHASAVALEAMLCSAGYSVCRISDIYGYDVRQCVYVNREIPGIEDYTNVLTHIRSIVKKNSDVSFLREEIVFAFSLYVSKIMGCKYVILENTTEMGEMLSAICHKYNYAIIPKIYDDISEEGLEARSKVIDRVTRGVVTGNNNFYRYFSDRCQRSGVRLSIHRSYDIIGESNRSRTINYGGREYKLKSSSDILCDAVISAIELVEIMKIQGAKIPPAKMVEGINSISSAGFMDVISSSPLIVSDISQSGGEISMLVEKLLTMIDKGNSCGISVCAQNKAIYESVLASVNGRAAVGEISAGYTDTDEVKYASVATGIIDGRADMSVLIIGDYKFVRGVKSAFVLMMNKL